MTRHTHSASHHPLCILAAASFLVQPLSPHSRSPEIPRINKEGSRDISSSNCHRHHHHHHHHHHYHYEHHQ
eukprot:5446281-Amphidinium_carterae.1